MQAMTDPEIGFVLGSRHGGEKHLQKTDDFCIGFDFDTATADSHAVAEVASIGARRIMFGPLVEELDDVVESEAAIVEKQIVLGWTREIAQLFRQPLPQHRFDGCQVADGCLRQPIGDDDGPFVGGEATEIDVETAGADRLAETAEQWWFVIWGIAKAIIRSHMRQLLLLFHGLEGGDLLVPAMCKSCTDSPLTVILCAAQRLCNLPQHRATRFEAAASLRYLRKYDPNLHIYR